MHRKKEHGQKDTGKMGTGKKGTSEKLGKKGTKGKKLFLFVDYFYYYLINIWTIQCIFLWLFVVQFTFKKGIIACKFYCAKLS